MDSRANRADHDIHVSADVCSGRLPRANFDLGIVQHAELDGAKGEEVERDLPKSVSYHTANAKRMDFPLENATRSP